MSEGDGSVIFALPTLGNVALEYKSSMLQTQSLLIQNNIRYGFIDGPGNPYIALAYNQIVTAFLDRCPGLENFFMIEDDVGWPAEKVVEFLRRPEDIIAGVPRLKQEKLQFPVKFTLDRSGASTRSDDGKLIMADIAPTGFMRVKRHVLERMAATAKRFFELDAEDVTIRRPRYMIFQEGIGPDETFWGQDTLFVRKAAAMGYSTWVDPDIEFTHRGSYAWCGRLKDTFIST
jgi:hypothetical protein